MANGRCPNHGGMSTGPRSQADKERIADAQRKRWAAHRAKVWVVWTERGERMGAWAEDSRHKAGDRVKVSAAEVLIERGFAVPQQGPGAD